MVNDVHIDLLSDRQIYIDGCKGLLEYRENIVRVSLPKKTLTVFGSDLKLEYMTEDSISLSGKIDSVSFE